MAAANAALLERKAAEAEQQAAEEQRIAAYIVDKAAREQVLLPCRVSLVFLAGVPHTAMQRRVLARGTRGNSGLIAHSACCPREQRHLAGMHPPFPESAPVAELAPAGTGGRQKRAGQ